MHPIRPARPEEFPRLHDIERIADQRYASVGLAIVLDMPTASPARLREGPVWVACDGADTPIAFVLAGMIDGFAYIDQLSVLPEHGRQGIGAALMRTVMAWARTTPAHAVILSTYRGVAWNEPFYRRHGFREMPEAAWTEAIRDARKLEARQGHDLARRLFMWRPVR
jgi:GNAT superfamily N-acetyltransferase